MTQRQSILAMAAIVLLLGALKLSQELYRFYVHRDERVEIARLEERIEEAGYGIIATQLRADTLRKAIEALDRELGRSREELDQVERRLALGPVSNQIELSYRRQIDDYNRDVRARNALYRRWKAVADSNGVYSHDYEILFDSIRTAADALGEPYYPIPTPAEIVARRRESEAQ